MKKKKISKMYFIPSIAVMIVALYFFGTDILKLSLTEEITGVLHYESTDSYITANNPNTPQFRPTVSFTYAGVNYENVPVSSAPEDAEDGSIVTVRVSPTNPTICFIPNNMFVFPGVMALISLLLLGAPFVFTYLLEEAEPEDEKSSEDDYYYDYNNPDEYYDYNDPANYNTGQVDDFLYYREEPKTQPEPVKASSETTLQPEKVPDAPTLLSEEKEISSVKDAEETEEFSYEPPETVLGTYDRIYNNPDREQEKPVDPLENYNPNDYGTDLEDLQDAYDKYFNYQEDSVEDDKFDYFFKKR